MAFERHWHWISIPTGSRCPSRYLGPSKIVSYPTSALNQWILQQSQGAPFSHAILHMQCATALFLYHVGPERETEEE